MSNIPEGGERELLVLSKSAPARGEIGVYGAKNAALVILASLILAPGKSTIKLLPGLSDTFAMLELLAGLGAKITHDRDLHQVIVNTEHITSHTIPAHIMSQMRASFLVAGPLLVRMGRAEISLPGGCAIGSRPIDYHLDGFRKLGVQVKEFAEDGTQRISLALTDQYYKQDERRICLPYPSVGATENCVMLAIGRPGVTRIINAALEPEVLDLIAVLRAMGGVIQTGVGAELIITGRIDSYRPVTHSLIPDRLETALFLLVAAVTGGDVRVTNGRREHLDSFLDVLTQMGHQINTEQAGIRLVAHAGSEPVEKISIKTGPYPGFPTDLQAGISAALLTYPGYITCKETVFENRFMHCEEFIKMGANITISGRVATILPSRLTGTRVRATDLRASTALMLAGLQADGVTEITGVHHWLRGHENLEGRLRKLGIAINRLSSYKLFANSEISRVIND